MLEGVPPAVPRSSHAPGRVNLIGDHTDYNSGLALPMAIHLGTEARFTPGPPADLVVHSDIDHRTVVLSRAVRDGDVDALPPTGGWDRLAAAVTALVRPRCGGSVDVSSRLPVGVGLSSSASFSVALALALGWEGDVLSTARLCQQAEHLAGSPVGLMDPLVILAARPGHALLIDFADLALSPVPVPAGADVVVVDSGERRRVAASAYAERREECAAAAAQLGVPLGKARKPDVERLSDPVLRRRAHHVVSECERVADAVSALRSGDLAGAGHLMDESHYSLATDFDVSTPGLDQLAEHLRRQPGIFGARLTGAGFGGCVVALCEAGAYDPGSLPGNWWRVEPSAGATSSSSPAASSPAAPSPAAPSPAAPSPTSGIRLPRPPSGRP
jgi:galactokinase